MRNPYGTRLGPPVQKPSLVCYADILGYKAASRAAIDSADGPQFLAYLRRVLHRAYRQLRQENRTFSDERLFALRVFTDNIVIGYPLTAPRIDSGEAELGHTLRLVSVYQASLALEGFFVRGGIAFGDCFMDGDVVFGEAFLEAVDCDQSGGPPRLNLAPSAVRCVQTHLSFYGGSGWAPHYEELLQDADGTIFVNYLSRAFDGYPDGGVDLDFISRHKKVVESKLLESKASPDIRAKFEWVARYHNYVCRSFAEEHRPTRSPESDEVEEFAREQAQKLLCRMVDIEKYAPEPSRLTLEAKRPPWPP